MNSRIEYSYLIALLLTTIFPLITLTKQTCPGFSKTGYLASGFQQKDSYALCIIECDESNGYFPADLNPRYNGTVNYFTVYRKYNGKNDWTPVFADSIADLNCQYGCTGFSNSGPPYFLQSSDMTIVTSDPKIKYYRASVQCIPGFFASNEKDLEENDMNIYMDCIRSHSGESDKWAWSSQTNTKIACVTGCKRFGTAAAVHLNAFGVKVSCNHVGKPGHSHNNLASSCEIVCDVSNGYYAVFDNFSYLQCGINGEFITPPFNFACDQGCEYTDAAKNEFSTEMHMQLICKSEIFDRFYGKCQVKCDEGYVISKRGRMGKTDVVFCHRGVFAKKMVRMECEKECSSLPDNCEKGRCVGENEYKQKFCSMRSIKYYPPEQKAL